MADGWHICDPGEHFQSAQRELDCILQSISCRSRGKRLIGCTARIVPNYSGFRKQNPTGPGSFAVWQSKAIHCAAGDWPDFKSYAVQRTHISTERVLCASDQSKSAYSGDAVRFPAALSLAETSSLTIRCNTYAVR